MTKAVGIFIGIGLVYLAGAWLILAYIPSVSVAARVHMSGRLWLYDFGGLLWGIVIGSSLVQVFLGGRPLGYGRWDLSRSRKPKTIFGIVLCLAVMTSVGVFFANMAVDYGIHHL